MFLSGASERSGLLDLLGALGLSWSSWAFLGRKFPDPTLGRFQTGQTSLQGGRDGQAGLQDGQAGFQDGQARLQDGQASLQDGQRRLQDGQTSLQDG